MIGRLGEPQQQDNRKGQQQQQGCNGQGEGGHRSEGERVRDKEGARGGPVVQAGRRLHWMRVQVAPSGLTNVMVVPGGAEMVPRVRVEIRTSSVLVLMW
ncbi:MAG: hypothetical protein CBC91_06325 [Rickettsiales bacterium TMED131]|nr:MAG: hypothetical protein CBC91_06325 [Rickettsiales bacterium TMED131]